MLGRAGSADGQGAAADSGGGRGPNQALATDQLAQVIGADTLSSLEQQTGLPRDELLARLARDLPEAVDKFTPEGRLPTDDELGRLF